MGGRNGRRRKQQGSEGKNDSVDIVAKAVTTSDMKTAWSHISGPLCFMNETET